VPRYLRQAGVFFIGLLASFAKGQNAPEVTAPTLAPVPVWNLLESRLFIVTKISGLPRSAQNALMNVLHQLHVEMGDREHKVKVRCPDCKVDQLIFAGSSSNGCFVYYMETGIAPSNKILVFGPAEQGTARLLWAAWGVPLTIWSSCGRQFQKGGFTPTQSSSLPGRIER
jgi:hypothetical protein